MIRLFNQVIHSITHDKSIPDSSGFVDEQTTSFTGRDEDFKTLFCLTNSLALFAAKAAWLQNKSHTESCHFINTLEHMQKTRPEKHGWEKPLENRETCKGYVESI